MPLQGFSTDDDNAVECERGRQAPVEAEILFLTSLFTALRESRHPLQKRLTKPRDDCEDKKQNAGYEEVACLLRFRYFGMQGQIFQQRKYPLKRRQRREHRNGRRIPAV